MRGPEKSHLDWKFTLPPQAKTPDDILDYAVDSTDPDFLAQKITKKDFTSTPDDAAISTDTEEDVFTSAKAVEGETPSTKKLERRPPDNGEATAEQIAAFEKQKTLDIETDAKISQEIADLRQMIADTPPEGADAAYVAAQKEKVERWKKDEEAVDRYKSSQGRIKDEPKVIINLDQVINPQQRIKNMFASDRSRFDQAAKERAAIAPQFVEEQRQIRELPEKQRAIMTQDQKRNERDIARINQGLDLEHDIVAYNKDIDRLNEAADARRDYIRQAAKESETNGIQEITAAMRDRAAIKSAQEKPETLSPRSQEIANQNKALLNGSIENLLAFAKAKYKVDLLPNGEPSLFNKFKSLFVRNPKTEQDPLFLSIQAELRKRAKNVSNALK